MKTINHECYVSLEIAILLKEAGFDWEVNSRWQDWCTKDWFLNTDLPYYEDTNGNSNDHGFSAPTLDVAQRWLREVKGNNVDVISEQTSDTKKLFVEYDVVIKKNGTTIWPDFFESLKTGVYPIGSHARTYEEALEAGIKIALEIILEKWELEL